MTNFIEQFVTETLPKLCKSSKLPVHFLGFTSDNDETIDRSLLQYAKKHKKYGYSFIYILEDDIENIPSNGDLAIRHATVLRNDNDKTTKHKETIKKFLMHITQETGLEMDWSYQIQHPFYLDTYADLESFTYNEDGSLTDQFKATIFVVCKDYKKTANFTKLYISVLEQYTAKTGIDPFLLENDHPLSFATTNFRRMTIKKLKEFQKKME